MSASLPWQSLALSQSPSISVTLTGNSVNSFVCVRFVYPSHISFKPNSSLFSALTRSLYLTHSCVLYALTAHIFICPKNPMAVLSACNAQRENSLHDLNAAKRNACRTQQAEIIWKSFLPTHTLTPCAPHHVLFIFFGLTENVLCFMVNLWRAYQCSCIQLQLLCPVRGRERGKRYTQLQI